MTRFVSAWIPSPVATKSKFPPLIVIQPLVVSVVLSDLMASPPLLITKVPFSISMESFPLRPLFIAVIVIFPFLISKSSLLAIPLL